MTRAASAMVALPLALGLAGCGSSSASSKHDPVFAGMTRSAALNIATTQSSSQTNDGSDPLYGHHLRLLGIKRGVSPLGVQAWVVRFRDSTDYRKLEYCLWLADGQYSGALQLTPC